MVLTVSALAFAALVAVLSVQGQLRIETIVGPVTEIHQLRGGVVMSPGAYGWVECTDGYVDRIVWNGNQGTLTHEALHAASCALTGEMKGRLLPHPPTEADAEHEWVGWCYQNQAACIARMEAVK